jgi:NAD(P)-dependent dehydrogenase (short-subunit alcohol dehydrogenase family)
MPVARRLENKVIIVTGASSGIGKSTALLLSQHGAKLGLLDVNTPTKVAAEITATGGQATGIQCDVRSQGQVEQAVKSVVEMYGPLHGKITNLWLIVCWYSSMSWYIY